MVRRIMLLGMALGLSLGVAGQQTHAQELPTGAARVVKKVQLMALTGTNEIKYKVDLIVENNTGKFPKP
jgi:hypothetical protein